jgi:acyl carrier protein
MTREEIFKSMVEILSQFVKDPSKLEGIDDQTKIIDDLGVNSARLIDIVLAVENQFDIELEDETLDTMQTIGDAINAILEEKGKDGA